MIKHILALLCLGWTTSIFAADKPNVIFILTDDLGYSDLSCYGAEVPTPHLDKLAASGFKSTCFHTAASICSPSRAAFLTGAYPQRAGLYMGINPHRDGHWFLGLNLDEITLPEIFKTKGYATEMVGKWHLGTEPEFHMSRHGFDTYYGAPCNISHDPRFFDGDKVIYAKTPLDKMTTLYTKRVKSIIHKNAKAKKPFFLYYAHNYPHTPYKPGPAYAGKSGKGDRGDIMMELDWSIGEISQALSESGIAENTIMIFTSDNGPTSNKFAKPYRGTKYVTLEGGHRVPFIMHWPARIKAQESHVPINAMDLFPTLSEIIDVPLANDRVYDGVSLLPLFSGGKIDRAKDKPYFYYNNENLQAIRLGDYKLHLPRTPSQLPHWEKNKAYTKLSKPLLFNLATDISESKDIAADHPEIVQQILTIADKTKAELGEYMSRGSGQRPTGTVIQDVPIIGNMKDWPKVDESAKAKIMAERLKRYPGYKQKEKTKGKKRKKRKQ